MGTWGTNWELHSLLVGAWWEQIEKRLGTIWNIWGTSEIYKNKTNIKKTPFGVGMNVSYVSDECAINLHT